jgi:hypothetical protein
MTQQTLKMLLDDVSNELSGLEADGIVILTVKKHPDGSTSQSQIVCNLDENDRINAIGFAADRESIYPAGHCNHDKDHTTH